MKKQEKNTRATQARQELIRISKLARMMQEESFESRTINQIIVTNFYTSPEESEFNTYKGWKEKGKIVKKGEKGRPIWGKKKGVTLNILEDKERGKEAETKNIQFFPIAYIFSNKQVEEIEEENEIIF
ncbi:hypothetical protein [Weeksella sp. HMSC059D05]|uniref:ArdC-like ssDNA-binding domain-containing protein n=1 Tax=Weeksella sp. HMSC059D05 TaxID=1715139 RepID=UPI0008A41739|nr:hypothetical protein [Weeksella sp. HMSC059D05]OFM84576.1 hypothetical protein HMPREF2660_08680 [Weeksella sp. HMSC059D05]